MNLTAAVSRALPASPDSVSPARPGLAELSVIGPWLAPLCPAINPDPLALGTVRRGSRPNPLPTPSLHAGVRTCQAKPSITSLPLHRYNLVAHSTRRPSAPAHQIRGLQASSRSVSL